MGRKRKNLFVETKMLAARVEKADYCKLDALLTAKGNTLQEAVNAFVHGMVSGSVKYEGGKILPSQQQTQEEVITVTTEAVQQ